MERIVLVFMMALLATLLGRAQSATRCYGNLGCYDSGNYHALPQEPSHLRTQFRVSCRNHTNDVIIDATSDDVTKKRQLETSCFVVGRATRFILHGFNDQGGAAWVDALRDLMLLKEDSNILAVDWHHGARFPYEQAVANTYLVAQQTAEFIRHLETVQGLSPLDVHLIGHSLGAQIAGNAGKRVYPSRVARITGLDPAEPYFDDVDDTKRLDSTDAIFVDVIHTDGERFTGTKGYGSLRSQGHMDFYPNGGVRQPGCAPPSLPDLFSNAWTDITLACSHVRAHELFAHSLDVTSCPMVAHACDSWADLESGNCSRNCSTTQCETLGMGLDVTSTFRGNLYLSTSSHEPYCGKEYRIEVHLRTSQSHTYGRVHLYLHGETQWSDVIDFSRSNRHYHSGDVEGHVITTNLDLGELRNVVINFERGSGLSALGTSSHLEVQKVNVISVSQGRSWQFCHLSGNPDSSGINSGTAATLSLCP